MRRFWFFWFFLILQLYLHQLPYFEMHTGHVNSTLTSSTRVYTMSILLFLFFPHFHSTLQCPYFCWIPVIPVDSSHSSHSSGIQWSPVEWNWIPVNSTGLQTEIEMKLESGSKHMCTNSCKNKYSIYTDFCGVWVISCTMGALWSAIQTDLGNYNQRLHLLFVHF